MVDVFGGGKFKEIDKQNLPDWIAESFEEGKYKTVITQEDIFVYRVFGGKASSTGAFVKTVPAGNRINTKIDAALLPEWKNSKESEAIIKIPKGTILNVGKVAPQTTKSGTILKGGTDQYLMLQNWLSDWIAKVNPLPSK
jgi:NAD(P)H-nitrite reductase large subunit